MMWSDSSAGQSDEEMDECHGSDDTLLMYRLIDYCFEDSPKKRGGSSKGKSANLPRDFEAAYQHLRQDYFNEDCLYNDAQFRRRF